MNTTEIPPTYNVTFEPGKRYLMRIINTAFETGFRFSIDGHEFQVVQTDLVPIEPYTRNSLVVHIGQRYNIVVQARDKSKIGDGNFWIRTSTCYTDSIRPGSEAFDSMKTGIVRYNDQSTDDPTDRTSKPWPGPQVCDDEPLGNIHPKLEWTVGPSTNSITQGENIALDSNTNDSKPYHHAGYLWDVKEAKPRSEQNFQIHYNDPIFLRLADPKARPQEVVVYGSENYTANDWVCIYLTFVVVFILLFV
jgi:FtsP/CotA-like multicopper oxidase with cupredoxin domain